MTIQEKTFYRRNPDLIFSDMDGETVMMSIQNGEYYGLDEVGSRIWQLLENPESAETLTQKLIEEYEVPQETCLSDVMEFLNILAEKQLIVPA
ncbi:MAG TPA: lasso peptide biosynthesis PqqD family chaperone [Bacteroidales bacterium]|nr:lasso peptide biosynthesis PqqD family chaperone [Bacteroidales bacterium]